MKILSSFDQLVNPSTQQAIENGCANIGGIDAVKLHWANENTDNQPIYDVYDEETGEYLFSIDTYNDETFSK